MNEGLVKRMKLVEQLLATREDQLAKARTRVEFLAAKRRELIDTLNGLKKDHRKPQVADYRLRIVQDEPRGWCTEYEMLSDVFGDAWCEDTECDNCAPDHAPNEAAREYIAAWSDRYGGIYAWGGILEERNRVTGEWEDTGDGCFGFYSLNGCAPEDAIVDSVVPPEAEGCEIVYGGSNDVAE